MFSNYQIIYFIECVRGTNVVCTPFTYYAAEYHDCEYSYGYGKFGYYYWCLLPGQNGIGGNYNFCGDCVNMNMPKHFSSSTTAGYGDSGYSTTRLGTHKATSRLNENNNQNNDHKQGYTPIKTTLNSRDKLLSSSQPPTTKNKIFSSNTNSTVTDATFNGKQITNCSKVTKSSAVETKTKNFDATNLKAETFHPIVSTNKIPTTMKTIESEFLLKIYFLRMFVSLIFSYCFSNVISL